MIRPEKVPMLREARWDELVQAAEEYLKTPLIAEPPLWMDGKWNAEEWRRNFIQASKAADISQTPAFCYLLSGDQRYGEGARKWLLHIASWNPAGSTSMGVNDEAGTSRLKPIRGKPMHASSRFLV